MFKGEFRFTIDERNRFTVPAKIREDLGSSFILTKGLDGCLFAYTLIEWAKLEEKMQNLSVTGADARAFSRLFFSGAMDIEVDKHWRVLIPQSLMDYAGLTREIVIVGVNGRVEIWDRDRWQDYSDKSVADYEKIAEKLEGFCL